MENHNDDKRGYVRENRRGLNFEDCDPKLEKMGKGVTLTEVELKITDQ